MLLDLVSTKPASIEEFYTSMGNLAFLGMVLRPYQKVLEVLLRDLPNLFMWMERSI